MDAEYGLRFLGTVQVSHNGRPVGGFRSRKALALLGYLAVQRQPTPRDQLVALFWEAQPEERARANLSWVLNRLTALLPGLLLADRHTVSLQRSPAYRIDIDTFAQQVVQGGAAALASAVDLYRGDFLTGMVLDGCAEFEIWLEGERERWRQQMMQALEALVAHHGRRGAYAPALSFARRLLALAPWQESIHRQVMDLLARCGQRSAALAQYEACRHNLAQELGCEPAPETTRLYERIRAAMAAPSTSLPPQPTPFIGREEELARVAELLADPGCRLLTILGPGGIGKTRLALQAAGARQGAYLEGVHYVPLASVSSAETLVSALAEALQLQFHERQPAQTQLLGYLHNRQALLVLDGFEHLLAARGLLVQILEAAPEVALLVTSRERLNLRWERCLELEGLSWPEEGAPAGDLGGHSAVQLFLQAARSAAPHLALSAQNAQQVVHICRLVEGMPLAIELAAAAVRTHTCEQIARHIEADLGFLASSMHDLPPRHRSMHAALAHSWRLLSPTERQVMMELSVFQQGFDAAAASEVAGATPAILEALVDKSLLRFAPAGRYGMHELLRQYAAEALSAAPGLAAEAGERHCRHYLSLLAEREGELAGAGAARAAEALRPEMGNLRAAWQWAAREGRLADLERSLGALARLYPRIGSYQEGDALLGAAAERVRESKTSEVSAAALTLMHLLLRRADLLNHCGPSCAAILAAQEAVQLAERAGGAEQPPAALADAYLQWGTALSRQGRQEEARARLEQALALSRSAARPDLQAATLRSLGNVCHGWNDLEGAKSYFRQALAIARQVGDRPAQHASLVGLARFATLQVRYAEGRAYFEEALRACREFDDAGAEALALFNLGYLCQQQGDNALARARYEESLGIARRIGDSWVEALALACLGNLGNEQGNCGRARADLEESLEIARRIGASWPEALAVGNLGDVWRQQGDYGRARAYYEEAMAIARRTGDGYTESLALVCLGDLSNQLADYGRARAQYEESLAIARRIGDPHTEGLTLACLGLLCHHLGQDEAGHGHARQAAQLAEEIGNPRLHAYALTRLGHTLLALGRPAEAARAYRRAVDTRRQLGEAELVMESLAGLARACLAQGDAAGASACVEEILARLQAGPLLGTDEPLRIRLTCLRVLQANGDGRVRSVLAQAHRLLMELAAKIDDGAQRRSFLHEVAAHRELLAEAEAAGLQ